jgi:GTPase involved in cell partitioning and DNA repair
VNSSITVRNTELNLGAGGDGGDGGDGGGDSIIVRVGEVVTKRRHTHTRPHMAAECAALQHAPRRALSGTPSR